MTSSPIPPLAREILNRRLIAAFATLDPDYGLHVVPMWFRLDGDRILLPTSGRSRKIQNLRRGTRATVMVDDSRGGLTVRGVMLTGSPNVVERPEARTLNRSIHLKYVTAKGLDLAQVQQHLESDDVTICLIPERVVLWDHTAMPGSRALAARGLGLPLDR
jgi:nitroimidazol reductase NimA-like FMN-containing flavoprotein (pyridoxamine 5'-phosphate oxidase superfamily)